MATILMSEEELANEHKEIRRIQGEIEAHCSRYTNVELKQPIESFLVVRHYLFVHGRRFVGQDNYAAPVGCVRGGTGYVHIPHCSSVNPGNGYYWGIILRNIIDEIHAQGAQRLVLDFRGCTGGVIYGFASGLIRLIIGATWSDDPKGSAQKLLETFDSSGWIRRNTDGSLFANLPWITATPLKFAEVIVLVDRNSASCGEMFPRLLELQGARVCGERTMGCASAIHTDSNIKLVGVKEIQFSNNMLINDEIARPLVPTEGVPSDIW